MNMVTIKAIGKSYDNKQVLRDINLSIREGEFFTLLGPSGCGKTTLLRIVAGFVYPDSGRVIFKDQDITELAAENRNVGMVFQNYALFPFMNVYENVAYGLKVSKVKKNEIEKRVKSYLKLVKLEGYEDRNVSELSGGEQQRVALARALVVEPRVLLLDEPLSNLDARLRDKMRMELKEIQRKLGITCIFVTHDQKEALTMSDRIAVFDGGQCIQVGTPKEIYSNPVDTFVATFIGETNLFEARVDNRRAAINSSFALSLSSDRKGKFISVRPQDILVSKSKIQEENSFEATIIKVIVGGGLEEYHLLIGDIELRAIKLNTIVDFEGFRENDRVWVSVDPGAVHVLRK
ncbi:MAG TPA: ABC transporter ATP-binding protein [Clostridia bacterium]|nr:ABC transporter ATP-binding protein [Clostridia bacterium]